MYQNDIDDELLQGLSAEGREIVLKHYGTKRHSGRYPYGSGKDPYQRARSETETFVKARKKFKDEGLTDDQIREKFGMTTTQWRDMVTRSKEEEKQRLYKEVKTRIDRGESRKDLADEFGVSLSTIDNYANMESTTANKRTSTQQIANVLKNKVDEVEYLDVSAGVEIQLGISKEKLRSTINSLTGEDGEYKIEKVFVPQVTNPNGGNNTTINVLMKKNVDKVTLMENQDKIRPVDFYFDKGNSNSLQNLQVPKSVDWDRVGIKYAIPRDVKGHGGDNDGAMMDGVMLIRPGVNDLSLGNNKYAQVRIAVGGSHYLKGMALYGDDKDFPKGVDIIFNTNKTKDVPKEKVLKPLKEPLSGMNPFGATIKRQSALLDKDGNPVINEKLSKIAKKLGNTKPVYENGAINLVNEEGDWGDWSKSLSAQFLSKQPKRVITERLDATLKRVDLDYDAIQKVNNPVIKKKLLENYANELESKQIHLKAAAPKGFQGHVILPVPKLKENEVFAPNYKNGERVILIRYPHGGTFEIPELIVNNNNAAGRKTVGMMSRDAIGIHPKVASKLSGADFDGDTAYVIPNNSRKFKSSKSLQALKNFDPSDYKDKKGTFTPMSKGSIGREMGEISNLITDMTMKGASTSELARAVKHSMVVIDAYKHELNHHRSAEENGIKALKNKYQKHADQIDYSKLQRYNKLTRKTDVVIDPVDLKRTGKVGTGASTVLSRRKQEVTTGGKIIEVPTPKGGTKTVIRNRRKSYVTSMLSDASVYLNKDSSYAEKEYVRYINELKKRKSSVDKEIEKVKIPKRDPKSAIIYKDEVKSLKDKLNASLSNAPRERQAQLLATKDVNKFIDSQGGKDAISNEDLKKYRNQALTGARAKVGAKRNPVIITDDEWDAIQSNAISANMLSQLTNHMDDAQLRQLATPKPNKVMSATKRSKAVAMINNGYTIAEVADMLGVSTTTISNIKKEQG